MTHTKSQCVAEQIGAQQADIRMRHLIHPQLRYLTRPQLHLDHIRHVLVLSCVRFREEERGFPCTGPKGFGLGVPTCGGCGCRESRRVGCNEDLPASFPQPCMPSGFIHKASFLVFLLVLLNSLQRQEPIPSALVERRNDRVGNGILGSCDHPCFSLRPVHLPPRPLQFCFDFPIHREAFFAVEQGGFKHWRKSCQEIGRRRNGEET